MAAYYPNAGGAWTTVSGSSRRSQAPPPPPLAADEVAEAVEGLEISAGERRLDKYEIPVEVSGDGAPPPADSFEAAGLAEAVLRCVARCGYDSPTPVQRYALPIARAGRDLMACAQTGSGKTAAFCLPVISGFVQDAAGGGGRAGRRDRGSFDRTARPRALILAPTRELAQQV
jgi:ATP-dependent RNA helicase DDX3X